jgi:hypothetical protein
LHDRRLFLRPALSGISHLLLDLFERLLDLFDGPPSAGAPDVGNSLSDVVAISRQVGTQARRLSRHDPAGGAQHGEDKRDHQQDSRDATEPPLQTGNGWGEHEGQQDRKRNGDEHRLGPIEDRDGEDAPPKRQPRLPSRIHHSSPTPAAVPAPRTRLLDRAMTDWR